MKQDTQPNRIILLPYGRIQMLIKEIGCNVTTARYALKGVTETEYAKRIRLHALNYLGGAYKGE